MVKNDNLVVNSDDIWRKKRDKFLLKIILSVFIVIGCVIAFIFLKVPVGMAVGAYDIDPRWGLGKKQTAYLSNDREYEWYVDKANTGADSKNNSGPACAVMASKWAEEYYDQELMSDKLWTIKAASEARLDNKKFGEKWTETDVMDYLDEYNIKYEVINDVDEETIKSKLEDGNIMIVRIDSRYLQYRPKQGFRDRSRIGQIGLGKNGYFLIIKGYRVVDDNLYFETYDPTSNYETFYKGELKGKNRYYNAENLLYTIETKWDACIMITDEQ